MYPVKLMMGADYAMARGVDLGDKGDAISDSQFFSQPSVFLPLLIPISEKQLVSI